MTVSGHVTRRQALHLVAGALVTATVAACGQAPSPPASVGLSPTSASGQSTTARPTPVQTMEPAPTVTPSPMGTTAASATVVTTVPTPAAAVTGSKLKGQLVISVATQIPEQAQRALSAAYQGAQPSVKLIWEIPSIQGPSEYETWLGTQLAAGNVRPDIVSSNYADTYAHYYDFNQARWMTNPYTGHAWDQDLDWDFFVEVNTQGRRIMLPTRKVHTMYFYNAEMFDQAGAKPPSDWSEFVDLCQRLQAKGFLPISANRIPVVGQWFALYYFDQYHIDWVNTVRAQPGDWNYDPDLDGKFVYDPKDPFIHNKYTYNLQRYWRGVRDRKLRYDTPEVAEIVKNMSQVFPRYANKDLFVTQDYYTPFLEQKAAMIFDGTWTLPTLQNDMKGLSPERLKALKLPADTKVRAFRWATFENVPMQGPLVKGPIRSSESASGEYVGIIDKNQTQTDLALNFVMFWLSKVGYAPYLRGYIESGRFAPSGPLAIHGVDDPPEVQKIFKGIKSMGNAAKNYNFWTLGGGQLQTTKQDLFEAALEGKLKPDEFAKQFQDLLTSHFDDLIKLDHLTKADIDNPAKEPGT